MTNGSVTFSATFFFIIIIYAFVVSQMDSIIILYYYLNKNLNTVSNKESDKKS